MFWSIDLQTYPSTNLHFYTPENYNVAPESHDVGFGP